MADTQSNTQKPAEKPAFPPMPNGYGEPVFSAPVSQIKAKRGGGQLLTRVTIPIPSVGLTVDGAVWRSVEETGDATNTVDELSIGGGRFGGVGVLDPVPGSRDNKITAAAKDAIMARWDHWYSAAAKDRPAVAGRLVRKPR